MNNIKDIFRHKLLEIFLDDGGKLQKFCCWLINCKKNIEIEHMKNSIYEKWEHLIKRKQEIVGVNVVYRYVSKSKTGRY